jgi:small subunit ribosomal protein S12
MSFKLKKRKQKIKKTRVPMLKKCPQKKGICVKVYTTSPKKPNSAVRKIVKLKLFSTKLMTIAGIPGVGHNLAEFAIIMIKGGKVKDVPGVRYKVIRGKFDCSWVEKIQRKQSRSKYGIPKSKIKK